jgi:hypothetical protein
MISPENLDELLRTVRKHRVSKIKFHADTLQEVEFFAKDTRIPRDIAANPQRTMQPAALTEQILNGQIEGMPTEEEFRFYHSPIVPAPEPISQEAQRNKVA